MRTATTLRLSWLSWVVDWCRTSRWSPWKAWHLCYGLPAEQRDLGRRGRRFTTPVLLVCEMKRAEKWFASPLKKEIYPQFISDSPIKTSIQFGDFQLPCLIARGYSPKQLKDGWNLTSPYITKFPARSGSLLLMFTAIARLRTLGSFKDPAKSMQEVPAWNGR